MTPNAGSRAPAWGASGGFRLMRYFAISTLVAFAVVGLVLATLQHNEEQFFAQVQREQAAFFARAQAQLAKEHEEAARASLLAVHEASHVNLTRLVANMLWDTEFAPLAATAQKVPVNACRAAATTDDAARAARRNCFAEIGRQIRGWSGFRQLDAKAYAAMHDTTVFKIKVFDLRGITIYSSEHAQIGEDASGNEGWRRASAGMPASELTHRDRFSAFEGVVENRDLISSYVPVRRGREGSIVGVFELYSDVTPFLGRIKVAAKAFAALTADNQQRIEEQSRDNQSRVDGSSRNFLIIVCSLLALLYAVSWLIVRHGQRLIDRQHAAQAQAAERERQWHREKMAALATMAANVSHEVGNPLAVIDATARDLPTDGAVVAAARAQILAQCGRVDTMMRQMTDFAAARDAGPEWIDVNARIKALCDFQSFDFRFRGMPIEFHPMRDLPPRELEPDHLNELLMGALQIFIDGATSAVPSAQPHSPIRIETLQRATDVVVRMARAGAPAPQPARADALARRAGEFGWHLAWAAGAMELVLPDV
ncbi:MAG: hypothetical protein JNJ42_10645 [Burkholderiaceae bacterium]|nr:hypothetical protein [Burkholderiaceae bacterium]